MNIHADRMSTENPKPKDIQRFFRKFAKVFSGQSESSTQQSVPDKENARHFASVFCFVALNYFQSWRIIYSFSYDEMHSKYTRPAQYNQHHTQHFYMFILNIMFFFSSFYSASYYYFYVRLCHLIVSRVFNIPCINVRHNEPAKMDDLILE